MNTQSDASQSNLHEIHRAYLNDYGRHHSIIIRNLSFLVPWRYRGSLIVDELSAVESRHFLRLESALTSIARDDIVQYVAIQIPVILRLENSSKYFEFGSVIAGLMVAYIVAASNEIHAPHLIYDALFVCIAFSLIVIRIRIGETVASQKSFCSMLESAIKNRPSGVTSERATRELPGW